LKVLYANTESIFQPFCKFSQPALVLASLRQAPEIKEGSIKDRPFFCTELSPGFTLITYSIEDGVFEVCRKDNICSVIDLVKISPVGG
jgi:hypothetical protein